MCVDHLYLFTTVRINSLSSLLESIILLTYRPYTAHAFSEQAHWRDRNLRSRSAPASRHTLELLLLQRTKQRLCARAQRLRVVSAMSAPTAERTPPTTFGTYEGDSRRMGNTCIFSSTATVQRAQSLSPRLCVFFLWFQLFAVSNTFG